MQGFSIKNISSLAAAVAASMSIVFIVFSPPAHSQEAAGGEGKADGGVQPEAPAASDDVNLAKEHFKKGVGYFKEESYEAALVEFLESIRLNPKWALSYNIAVCYMLLKKYAKSLEFYRAYLAEGGSAVPEGRKSGVEADIKKLELMVGQVSFCCGLAGGKLVLDDVETLDEVPAKGILLDPGFHKVKVRMDGCEDFIAQIKVIAGGKEEIKVDCVPLVQGKSGTPAKQGEKIETAVKQEQKDATAPQQAPAAQGKKKLPKYYGWLIGGLAGAGLLAAGAAATGAFVLASRDRMNEEAGRCQYTDTREQCPEAYTYFDRAKDLRLAANILAGAAVVCGAVGLAVFLALWSKARKKEASREKVTASFFYLPDRMISVGLAVEY